MANAIGAAQAAPGKTTTTTPVAPATKTGVTGSATGGSAASKVTLGKDLNQFLSLLTAQLKNQDPLSPLDTNQFTQQLVSFSQVEQTIATNTNLEKIIGQNEAAQLTALGGLVGQTVEAESDRFVLADGVGTSSYELKAQSDTTRIRVMDERGRIIAEGEGETGVGRHEFTWDGRIAGGGNAPDGIYRIAVSAVDADGNATPLATSVVGVATGAVRTGDTLSLQLGPLTIAAGKVNALHQTVSRPN